MRLVVILSGMETYARRRTVYSLSGFGHAISVVVCPSGLNL